MTKFKLVSLLTLLYVVSFAAPIKQKTTDAKKWTIN